MSGQNPRPFGFARGRLCPCKRCRDKDGEPAGRLARKAGPAPVAVKIKVKSDGQECPAHTSYSSPNSLANAFHLLSTSAFVFASMTISSGQGRVKPSVGH